MRDPHANPNQLAAHTRATSGAHGVEPGVVLVSYDRSPACDNALAYAAGIAERTYAQLVVLFVDDTVKLACAPDDPARVVEAVAAEVGQVLDHRTTRYDVAVAAGDPAGVIQRVAADLRADVVVVGRAHHPRLHPFGSVPTRLARRADQPVVVVP